jgi:hypothetical protein
LQLVQVLLRVGCLLRGGAQLLLPVGRCIVAAPERAAGGGQMALPDSTNGHARA